MAAGPSQTTEAQAWSSFTSAESDEAFCRAWLALQCSVVTGVSAGLLLLRDAAGESFVPAAVWPDNRRDLSYLTEAAERALSQGRGSVLGLDDSERERIAPDSVHVAFPIETDDVIRGAVVLDILSRPQAQLQAVLRQLLWGAGWLEAMLRRKPRSSPMRARRAGSPSRPTWRDAAPTSAWWRKCCSAAACTWFSPSYTSRGA